MSDDKETSLDQYRAQRDLLAESIARAAIKAGIAHPDVPMTGPHLVMLCDNLADAVLHKSKPDEPLTPEKIISLIGHNYNSMEPVDETGRPLGELSEVKYSLTVHDLMSAFGQHASRGTDDELVNAATDAQMNVECLEASLQDARKELCEQYGEVEQLKLTVERMTVALEQISTIVANPSFWGDSAHTSFNRGFIQGACELALGRGGDAEESRREVVAKMFPPEPEEP